MSRSNAPPKENHFGEEIRGGTRGGLEEFKWESLRAETQRDRECYLGSSMKLGMLGKMGRFRKHDWWTESTGEVDKETTRLKTFEDTLMQEAVGARPKFLLLSKSDRDQMDQQERDNSIKALTANDGPTDEAVETLMIEKNELQLKLDQLVKQCEEIARDGTKHYVESQRAPDMRRGAANGTGYHRRERRSPEYDNRRERRSPEYDNRRERRRSPPQTRRPHRHISRSSSPVRH